MRFENHVAIVTGAGGAIGYAISCKFAAAGACVVATDVNKERLERTAEAIKSCGGKVLALEMDVTSTDSVKRAVNEVLTQYGRIDILVNNAGGSAGLLNELTDFKDAREEVWQWVLDLNLQGTMRCTQAVLPAMLQQHYGRIISMSSIAAQVGILQRSDYAAAKAGILGFSRTLAMELGKENITVNCVSPGLISRDIAVAPDSPQLKSSGTYLGRCGTPEEIANAVLFLADRESGYITGENITVDGGRVLGPKA